MSKAETETESSPEISLDISSSHKEYLVERHGRFDLDPLPQSSDEDPLNWSPFIKMAQLVMVAFHAFSTTFMAAGLIPAFAMLAERFNTSITACTYLTSAQIIILGCFPFLWIPIMNRYGRRQLLLVSTLGSMIFNIGCMYSNTYGKMMVCRIFAAFMISPAVSVGGPVVSEVSFSHQRGSRTGLWAVMITLGTHFGPFLMGFVEYQTGHIRNVFLIFVVMNAIQFLGYLIIGRETVYDKNIWHPGINTLWKIQPKTCYALHWKVFIQPLTLFLNIKVLFATIAYSICFSYANIALGVELTTLYHEKYAFNSQQIGLQFIGLILGSILGEILGGKMSDMWMNKKRKASNLYSGPPEYRLWLSYIGYVFVIVGLIVYGVMLDRDDSWTVVPVVGLALAGFGLQTVSTVLITYAIDTLPTRASDISLFVTLVRQVLGFVGPFYFPPMLENPVLKISGTYCLLAGLVVVFAVIPTFYLHLQRN
ncbi:putative efflux pump Vrtlp [[Candida] railenensis]|uniref:Efflux pump Vrtlp n=1 Tax=[Candida] railenensis TaxID=45579 RepID=A0A9P0QS01_9ASCO|nr:putative efflux pump Vrtlp [[Candida] railenensis]